MKKITAIFIILIFSLFINAQTTVFTYQGKLNDNSMPANGNYEFTFKVYDTATVGSGNHIGGLIQTVNATVVNGIFTVQLDFGSQMFFGDDRFLEISVRRNSSENFVTLEPRQPITSSPYSIRSKNAETAIIANNTQKLGGIDAAQYVLTDDSRMTDERNPLAGSANYIQNGTVQQTSTNFNISGEGKANMLTAETQFNIGSNRILSNAGTFNLFIGANTANATTSSFNTFVGSSAGRDTTTGDGNSFFGSAAGRANTLGSSNSFFGRNAGINNLTGNYNSFFGKEAGFFNTNGENNTFLGGQSGLNNSSGSFNTFVGIFSGLGNMTGSYNAFFGSEAGRSNLADANAFFGSAAGRQNSSGTANAFFGADAGRQNTTGKDNAYIGTFSGYNSTTGQFNTFVGVNSGFGNTTGSNNTLIGNNANVGANNLNFATAIGSGAMVSTDNTIVLGRSNGADKVRIPGLGTAGNTPLCRNANNEIATCSTPFAGGEAEKNEINKTLAEQARQIEEQHKQIEMLKKIVCEQNKTAAICAEENQ